MSRAVVWSLVSFIAVTAVSGSVAAGVVVTVIGAMLGAKKG